MKKIKIHYTQSALPLRGSERRVLRSPHQTLRRVLMGLMLLLLVNTLFATSLTGLAIAQAGAERQLERESRSIGSTVQALEAKLIEKEQGITAASAPKFGLVHSTNKSYITVSPSVASVYAQ